MLIVWLAIFLFIVLTDKEYIGHTKVTVSAIVKIYS